MFKYFIIFIHLICFVRLNTIEKIAITGNFVTTDNTILRYIEHNIGDTINIDQAIEEQLILYNTGLFDDVIIIPTDSIYYVMVFEKPPILPRPRIDKHDVLGWSAGVSVLFNNINGENKKLNIGALTGKTTIIDLLYSNPFLPITKDSLNIKIYNKIFESIEKDYKINQIGLNSSLNLPSNNTSNKLKIKIGYEYNQINFTSNTIKEKLHTLKATLSYKNISNIDLLQRRNIFSIDYSILLFKDHYTNYNKVKIKNDFIIPFINNKDLGRFVITNQCIVNFSKAIPIYDKIFLNTETLVRGYDPNPLNYLNTDVEDKLKWNNIITTTFQIELPLFKKNTFKTEFLLFGDYGIGANKYHDFNFKQKLEGFGFGVRIEYIKTGNVDLCFGVNPYGERNFHAIANFKSF